MTQKAFCEKHNRNIPQFAYYHGQFRREKELPTVKPSFVPVKIPRDEKSITTSEIKLSLPNGLAHEAIQFFKALYKIEKEAREGNLSPQDRFSLREKK